MGTTSGVIKCRIVNRLAEEDRWSMEFVLGMQGAPWQPVPGRHGQHILVEINENGEMLDEEEENETPPREDKNFDEEDLDYQKKTHSLHVSRKAILKYGTTEGCPACNAINRRGHLGGRVGYNHNEICRRRVMQAMLEDLEYRLLVYKHEPHQQAGEIEIIIEE